jgi:hypothetical protein
MVIRGLYSNQSSQVVEQEALTRLLMEKRIFTRDEFLEMVKAVVRERKEADVRYIISLKSSPYASMKYPLPFGCNSSVVGWSNP